MQQNNVSLYHPVTIGNLTLDGNLFLAPVAGYSDRAFRAMCRAGGANFSYTEMVSSEALIRGSAKTELLMARAQNETSYAVQIFGGDAAVMSRAAEIVCQKAKPSLIDINAGCPVPKITKTGAGSALTREPALLYEIVRAVVQAADLQRVPVTVKIRSGWDAEHLTWKEALCAAIEAGASAITVHPRTRAQGYEGKADWDILAQAVDIAASCVQGGVPVFGSGDIFCPEDALRMLGETGVDGVMFARGAMGNPFVFEETRALLTTGAYEPVPAERRIKAGLRELELLIADTGEYTACREMRKRFCAYTKGMQGGAELRKKIVAAETQYGYETIFSEFSEWSAE
jgi:nifR3 family TIM-barrel protein